MSSKTKNCHSCQAAIDIDERKCPYCGQKQLCGWEVGLEQFIKSVLPRYMPATRILFASIIIYFIIISIDILLHTDLGFKGALLAPPGEIMYRWGAHLRGETTWWRLITANFLHFGLLHILFNAYALRVVSPYVERFFGSAMTIASFIVLGTGSMLCSNLLGGEGIVAGASGSIMGFIGLAAVAAHREHTTLSIQIRNSMLKWAAITMVFGIMVTATGSMGVDNIAHLAGFAFGAVAGAILPGQSVTGFTKTWMIRGARLLCAFSLIALAAAFSSMGFASVSTKYQQECISAIKFHSFEKAEESCSLAYQNDKTRMVSYHNYILIKLIKNDKNTAAKLCTEGRKRFSNAKEPVSFDEMCRSIGR